MRLLRFPDIRPYFGFKSDTSIKNWVRDGLLPPRIWITKLTWGLPDYEVEAVARARIAGKTDDEIRELVKVLTAQRTAPAAIVQAG